MIQPTSSSDTRVCNMWSEESDIFQSSEIKLIIETQYYKTKTFHWGSMPKNVCFLLKRMKVVFKELLSSGSKFMCLHCKISLCRRKFKISELRISQCFDFPFLRLLTRMLVCVRSPYTRCVTEGRKYSRNVILLADVPSDLVIRYSSW